MIIGSLSIVSYSIEQTLNLGKQIGSFLKQGDIIALQGTLGAGKTTITKGIAKGLEITENITSPTFSLISEYAGRLPLFHMDVYRLDSAEDFIDLGIDEMLYGSGVCVIEWSEKIMTELPEDSIILKLKINSDGSRVIIIDNWPYGEIDVKYTGN